MSEINSDQPVEDVDDVEGHHKKVPYADEPEGEDVEGHMKKIHAVDEPDGDDVEGHMKKV